MPWGTNLAVVNQQNDVIVELHFFTRDTMDGGRDDWWRALRYLSLLETQPGPKTNRLDGVWFSGRMSIDQVYASTFYYCTYIIEAPTYVYTEPKIIREIIHDYSISSNVAIEQHGGRYYAFGGEDKSGEYVNGMQRLDDRDGIRVLEADSFEALQTNWSRPVEHQSAHTAFQPAPLACSAAAFCLASTAH